MSGSNFGRQTASGHLEVPAESKEAYPAEVEAAFRRDAAEVVARYPQKRSALLPLLHLVQSVDGYITGRGIELCAELLDLSTAEVSGVATFYTQYKRHPNGEYTVGVCTNTLCAVMGGDAIWEAVSEHLGIGHDETTEDGRITLERLECNAACDYAPVVMTNWEFFDNQTPESTIRLVDDLRDGKDVTPTRGPAHVRTFKEVSRTLAGFNDGLAAEGVGAGPASLVGLELAHDKGWTAPGGATIEAARASKTSTDKNTDKTATNKNTDKTATDKTTDKTATDKSTSDGDAPGRPEVTPASPEAAAGTQAAPAAADPTDQTSGPGANDRAQVTDADSPANATRDKVYDVGFTESDNRASDNRASDNAATDTEDET